jgi:6-phosphofructokinase 2
MAKIVTLTMNPTIDKSSAVSQVVADRKLRCKVPRFEPGGGGLNVSRAVRELGGESLALYPAGGHTGDFLEQLLREAGIEQHRFRIENRTRENLTVLEESTNRQFRIQMPGPALKPEEWKTCLGYLAAIDPRPEYIVASGSLPPGVPADFYARLAEQAKAQGVRLIVDTSGEALRIAADAGVFLLKPNLRELADLAGRAIEDESQPEALARETVATGHSEVVVLSLGSGGALLVTRDHTEHIQTPAVPIRSRVGAGDSTVAGIVFALGSGRPLAEAVRYGIAAGAAAVLTPGTELCRKEDVERLFSGMTAVQA